jgi:hypothetical protein
MEDFRKADPKYFGFVPKTAAEAIDLFFRLKRNGMHCEHHPEAFVWCTRALDDEEGAKFEDWLIAPQGISATAPLYQVDPAIEAERKRLEKEANARDLADRMELLAIVEEADSLSPMSRSETHDEKEDVEMVSPSKR